MGGAYIWNGAKWVQLITSSTWPDFGPPTATNPSNLRGTWAVAIAPNLTSRLYLVSGFGYTYRSDNSGATWYRINNATLPQITNANGAANNLFKFAHPKLAVDPINADHVIMAVPGQGAWRTTDGGSTWARITAITDPTPIAITGMSVSAGTVTCTVSACPIATGDGGESIDIAGVTPSGYNGTFSGTARLSPTSFSYFLGSNPGTVTVQGTVGNWGIVAGICLDYTSAAVSGKTGTVYAASYGVGVFQSLDGGATWNPVSGSPVNVWTADVAPDGKYWCGDRTNTYYYVSGSPGTWTTIKSGYGTGTIACDRNNVGHVVVSAQTTGGSAVQKTLNNGGAWLAWSGTGSGNSQIARIANTIPWMAFADTGFMTIGQMKTDPSSGDTWFAEGIGVFKGTIPNTQANWSWNADYSYGIEELVANDVICPASTVGRPITASWDRGTMLSPNDTTFPSSYGPGANVFTLCTSVDYAYDDPNFIVALSQSNISLTDQSGYSIDGGQTWTIFGAVPSNVNSSHYGGCIAVSTKGTDHTTAKIVWLPGNGVIPSYSSNGGATWTLSSGLPSTGLAPSVSTNAHAMCVDKVNGDFYLHCSTAGSTGGIYKSTDGGATWTQVLVGPLSGNAVFAFRLRSSPYAAGDLWATDGFIGGFTANFGHAQADRPIMALHATLTLMCCRSMISASEPPSRGMTIRASSSLDGSTRGRDTFGACGAPTAMPRRGQQTPRRGRN